MGTDDGPPGHGAAAGELYLDQRYLTAALGALPAAPQESGGSFATDGGALYYPTAWLLDTYRRNRRYLPRAYLHSLFHCIFRHLWLRDRRDPDLWGLACDIAVEATLDTLNTPAAKRPSAGCGSNATHSCARSANF